MSTNTDDRLIAFGSALKMIKPDTVGGYLVRFTGPDVRDLEGEYFDASTDFYFDDYPVMDAKVLYNHGFDSVLGVKTIGRVTNVKVDDVGVWAEAQLKEHDEYLRMVRQWVDQGIMGWSSGALPQGYKADEETGHIRSWPIIDASLTLTPAMPLETRITTLKSVANLLRKEASDPEDARRRADGDVANTINQPLTKDTTGMDAREALRMIRGYLDEMLGGLSDEMKMEDDEQDIAKEAMDEEVVRMMQDDETISKMEQEDMKMSEEDMRKMTEEDMRKMTEEERKRYEEQKYVRRYVSDFIRRKSVISAAVQAAARVVAQKRSITRDTARDAAKSVLEDMRLAPINPANSPKAAAGGVAAKGATRITVGEMNKYAHMTNAQMALAFKMMMGAMPAWAQRRGRMQDLIDQGIASEAFIKTLGHRIIRDADRLDEGAGDQMLRLDTIAVKSSMPVKANELDATDITAQGLEWPSVYYDRSLWERARNITVLFNTLVEKGMRVEEIPQGARSMNVKLNTSSPTVYTRGEPNNTDNTGRPEATVNVTPWGTDEIEVAAKQHALATAYSHELEEDSIIPIVDFLDREMTKTMAEALEDAIINGDTTTAANSNINRIDGVVPTGNLTPLYIAWDGLRHNFLVENTSQGADAEGSAISAAQIESLIAILPPEQRSDFARQNELLIVVDSQTDSQVRRLPEILTDDVLNRGGTIHTGKIPNLYGVSYYMSGFLLLSNDAGSISVTEANNAYGTMIVAYAPYWQYGRKRSISIEFQRDIQSGATVSVASIRHVLVARGANAAVGRYHIGV